MFCRTVDVLAARYNSFCSSLEQKHQEQMSLPEYVAMTEKLYPQGQGIKGGSADLIRIRTKGWWFEKAVPQAVCQLVESAPQSREEMGNEDSNHSGHASQSPSFLPPALRGWVSETLPTQTLFHVPAPGGRWSDSLRGAVISFSLPRKVPTELHTVSWRTSGLTGGKAVIEATQFQDIQYQCPHVQPSYSKTRGLTPRTWKQ